MRCRLLAAVPLMSIVAACNQVEPKREDALVGAWRGSVQFQSGAFAAIKDLEFMYAFNAGGTMTESSNYDGSPPVPPAYGIWKKRESGKYAARYTYYWTKPPSQLEEITKGNGWSPGGYGILSQEIVLSPDGKSFDSTIKLQMFDAAGKPLEQESIAAAKAVRFEIQ
jgi:hypothetical protein